MSMENVEMKEKNYFFMKTRCCLQEVAENEGLTRHYTLKDEIFAWF